MTMPVTEDGVTFDVLYQCIFNTNNTLTIKMSANVDGENMTQEQNVAIEYIANDYQIRAIIEGAEATDFGYSSADGKAIYVDGVILKIADSIDTTILKGARITPVEGSSMENIMSGNPMPGDTVEYDGYIYKYNQMYVLDGWHNIEESEEMVVEGWGVKVQDDTLVSYPDMQSNVYGIPVTNLVMTYWGCTNMVKAPALSSEAINMGYAFINCNLLEECVIPEKVEDLSSAFAGCVFPENVTNMNGTFSGCTSLSGTITINTKNLSASYYSFFLNDTVLEIKLIGECPLEIRQEIAKTANNGNETAE